MPRLEHLGVRINRKPGGYVAKAQIGIKSGLIDLARDRITCQQSLDLGRKADMAVIARPVKRFDAQPITYKEQLLFLPIPKGDGKHANQALDGIAQAPMGNAFKDDFGIGMAAPGNVGRGQLFAQFRGVIDFAVIDHDITAIGGMHRLLSGIGKINDGKAALPKGQSTFIIHPDITAIRPTVIQRIIHARYTIAQARCISLFRQP